MILANIGSHPPVTIKSHSCQGHILQNPVAGDADGMETDIIQNALNLNL